MVDKKAPWEKAAPSPAPVAKPSPAAPRAPAPAAKSPGKGNAPQRTEWRLPNPDLVKGKGAPPTEFIGGSQRPQEDESDILEVDWQGAQLAVTAGPQKGRQFPLGDKALIGREQPADIIIEDTAASRRHAQIYKKNGRWYLKDLGSTNGTYLDGPLRGAERMLWDGDVLRIGDCELTFTDPESKRK